jgi:16S rRNA (guanine1516-N2)-methyltransferase
MNLIVGRSTMTHRSKHWMALIVLAINGLAVVNSLIWWQTSSDRRILPVFRSPPLWADRTLHTHNTSQSRRRVFVLAPQDDNERHIFVAKEMADSLSIPLLSLSDLSGIPEDFAFDHAIALQPYDDESLLGASTDTKFALSIQPIMLTDIKRFGRRSSEEFSFAMKPVFVDFCPPEKSGQPQKRSGKDLLVQAVSLQRGKTSVLDLTAGFGQDSLVLVKAVARQVTMVERDPIIHMLLDDARRRLELIIAYCSTPTRRNLAAELLTKLHLTQGEGMEVAKERLRSARNPDDLPDVVYIDQMFPPRAKRASVKKNMQVLHSLLHSQIEICGERESEESALLKAALSVARSRVVCKRPLNAPPIGLEDDRQPSFSVRGSTNRWDVYLA